MARLLTTEQHIKPDAALQQRAASSTNGSKHQAPCAHANHRAPHEWEHPYWREAQQVIAGTAKGNNEHSQRCVLGTNIGVGYRVKALRALTARW